MQRSGFDVPTPLNVVLFEDLPAESTYRVPVHTIFHPPSRGR